ncbi:hypothetical protein QYM36_014325 [Artemia franciscana]|uniref:Uncharacterized protein n=1 Tax=Artemia franciscana TaxID=6661 RepID=A0AA88HKF0_ARTSF|nr:hypothetical protein QYM36_014325 [Artemia franciscana]
MQEQVARFDVMSQMADDPLSPIMEWLDKNEKKIRDLEEHNLLHEEIVAKTPGFETLSDTASALMILVGDKEACGLADKVAYITDHYVG